MPKGGSGASRRERILAHEPEDLGSNFHYWYFPAANDFSPLGPSSLMDKMKKME